MNCMKCGREIDDKQVFCENCRLDMEKYPVKPGTAVQLPRRKDSSNQKKAYSRRKTKHQPEEQVKLLRKRLHVMTAIIVVLLVLVALLGWQTAEHLMEDDLLPGQNYSAIQSAQPDDAE